MLYIVTGVLIGFVCEFFLGQTEARSFKRIGGLLLFGCVWATLGIVMYPSPEEIQRNSIDNVMSTSLFLPHMYLSGGLCAGVFIAYIYARVTRHA